MVLAAVLAVAFFLSLLQQHRAARLELLRECGDGPPGLGNAFAMHLGFLGRMIDLGGAVADRADEAGGGSGIVGHFAGRRVLLGNRAVDVLEHRADRFDRLRDAMHGVDRTRGVALQRFDLLGDLFSRVLGLHRERLHLGGDYGEAAPGLAGARGLDGGIERQQRGLPRDLRDQVDDIADRR